MTDFVGYAVSVSCGSPLGCYQGTILEADGATITLTKAFRNGFPYPKPTVTLNASDIKELSIISARASPPAASTVPRATRSGSGKGAGAGGGGGAGGARARAPVCDTLRDTAPPARPGPARSKPIDIQGNRNNKNNNTTGCSQPAGSGGGSTPRSRGGGGGGSGGGGGGGPERARRRNEACFGSEAETALGEEFDFEKNLALFDKQALWQQMRSTKPDLVRQTEAACGKFRHDENVVGGAGAAAQRALRPISVPPHAAGALTYVTDEGVSVPSVAPWVRRLLWSSLCAAAPPHEPHVLLARAAADVALRLVGGGRRLDPRNAHQPPVAVLLLHTHRMGLVCLSAGRLLASHGARVCWCACEHGRGTGGAGGAGGAGEAEEAVRAAGAQARAAGLGHARAHTDLPPAADLVLLAAHDPYHGPSDGEDCALGAECLLLTYARGARGALLGLEPPPEGFPALELRASVCALLPAAGGAALGRLHLADVAPPAALFTALGLRYRTPFGAHSALPLHPEGGAD